MPIGSKWLACCGAVSTPNHEPGVIVEDPFEKLRPNTIELQMRSSDLRRFTIQWQDDGAGDFAFLRDSLFSELGLTYPDFTFAVNEGLKPDSVRFTINHLPTLPLIMLGASQCAVTEVGGTLPPDVAGEQSANAVTRAPQKIIDIAHRPRAVTAGLTTWNQIEYLILCLAEALRVHGACLVDRRTVERGIAAIDTAYPRLVEAAKQRVSVEEMTRLVRRLADEQISIKNFRLLLEALVDLPPGEPDPLTFLRHALQREIAAKHARGTPTSACTSWTSSSSR